MDKTLSYQSRKKLNGEINLTASKSESNRALIIRSLCEEHFEISNLAEAEDTKILTQLLKEVQTASDTAQAETDEMKSSDEQSDNNQLTLSVGIAGTVMRFMTAFLAVREGQWLLTSEERMKERPIRILVEALQQLGADIKYVGKEGYPPLKINGKKLSGGKVILDGSVSSQYVSALLMIAPTLTEGLEIEFAGEIISKPYIDMTISMMEYFGAKANWSGNTIKVNEGNYQTKEFTVEADWSAASYWYGFAALANEFDVTLYGLKKESLQGDAVVADIYKNFGVNTEFIENGIRITKQLNYSITQSLQFDFSNCPDIAQTVAVTCATLNVKARLTGLKTLRIKETDRIAALQTELNKLGFSVEVDGDDLLINRHSRANGNLPDWTDKTIKTYNDHRMAMAFSPLSLINEITIEDAEVVKKSYPIFWEDLEVLVEDN